MKSAVFDFKSINRIVNRQEQKAEFEAKNPKEEPAMYGWPYGVAVPYVAKLSDEQIEELRTEMMKPGHIVYTDGLIWSDYQQAWVSADWKPVLDAWGVKI